MNFKTHNDRKDEFWKSSEGTCLQGFVYISYKDLIKVFGESFSGDGYKVDAKWSIMFEDGTCATIYNYKDGKNYNGASGTATSKITNWHIGGINKHSVELVLKALGR